MGKWVPPVPAEKLYGRDALALGSGLVMLLWCYDGVERDGSVKVDLMAVAAELETPYRTIKDWWKALRNGPFFASVKDRGKLGYVATFNRDWIEWRVMATNYPTMETSEGQETALEPPLNEPEQVSTPVQGPVKAPSRPDDGQDTALDGRMYKVLQTDKDQIEIAVAIPAKKKRTPKPVTDETVTPIEIRQALADVCDVDISPGAKPPVKMIALLNGEAKAIWQQMQSQGKTVKAAVVGIREAAKYTRLTDKRFTNSASRLPIPIIRENWTATARWSKEQSQPYLNGANGHANGSTAPVLPAYDYDQELNPNSPEYRASLRGAR